MVVPTSTYFTAEGLFVREPAAQQPHKYVFPAHVRGLVGISGVGKAWRLCPAPSWIRLEVGGRGQTSSTIVLSYCDVNS